MTPNCEVKVIVANGSVAVLEVPDWQENIARLVTETAQFRARASLQAPVNTPVLTQCARFESRSGARPNPCSRPQLAMST